MGIFLLFGPVLVLMLIHAKATEKWASEARDMREAMRRMESQITKLAIAMDATNQTLGPLVEEAVIDAVIAANDAEAEAAELEHVVTADTHRTVLDEAA